MSGITITSQRAQLDIRSTSARLNIQNPHPRLYIRTRRARMSIERINPTFKVNWEQVRAESGNKPIMRQGREAGYEGYQQGTQAVGEIVVNGNRMGDMTLPEAAPEIAYDENVTAPSQEEWNVASMPENLPEIKWDVGSMDVSWEPFEMEVEWVNIGTSPVVSVDPHTLEIKMGRYPEVKITFDPKHFDTNKKKKVDVKI